MKTIAVVVNLIISHLSFAQSESYSLNSLKIVSSLEKLKGEEFQDNFKEEMNK